MVFIYFRTGDVGLVYNFFLSCYFMQLFANLSYMYANMNLLMKSLYLRYFFNKISTPLVDLDLQYESKTIQAPVAYFCTVETGC